MVASRFGYLGSTLRPGATPGLQADVYAKLLDALGIDRAGVIALSAGAHLGVQFTLRNPSRVDHGYRFGEISVPTLVISAVDDAMAPHAKARAMAEAIPGARLLAIRRGGQSHCR